MAKYIYPECRTVDVVENWFGRELPDPYAWLKQAKDPEVLDFVARENKYTDEYFASRPVAEKIAQLKAAQLPSLPAGIKPWKGGYIASLRHEGIPSNHVLDAELKDQGKVEVPEALKGYTVFGMSPCPTDDRFMVIMAQYLGAPRPAVFVCDMTDGRAILHQELVFSYCWSAMDGCLYYSFTESDAETQTAHSRFLRFDPQTEQTTVVYEDDSYCIFGRVSASTDGRYVQCNVCRDYSLARWVALDVTDGSTVVLSDELVEWNYLDSLDGKHYFITMTGAPQGQIIAVTADGVEVVMPESERFVLAGGFNAGGQLFIQACEDVSARLIRLKDGEMIPLPDPMGDVSVNGTDKDGAVFLTFQSFTMPPQILRFDGETMTPVLRASDVQWPDVVTEQFFAPSTEDGEMIPYYLVRRRDAKKDGANRVLMYAYGGYNNAKYPTYMEMVTNVCTAAFVQAGGIFISANLRGGSEYGAKWHEGGMRMTKRHCYEDFIGIAEALIRDGWTKAGQIGITGCSNGGLLMSALVTMRPDLWGCVIDSVPHTDMIHFAEDDRGPMYITEYGNPRESKEMFEYLLSYSPYHNVKQVNYPPTYIQTGEMDNNVPPYHGKKFAARMQASNQSDNPILLRVLALGSHDRGQGEVFWQTIAEMHTFLEEHLGVPMA